MQNQLFRQKSVEHISSPEALHDYMRVTSPRIWMLLAAILVLMAGFIVFASMANMEETIPVEVEVSRLDMSDVGLKDEWLIMCTLPASQRDIAKPGMDVRFAGQTGKVSEIYMNGDIVGVIIETKEEVLTLPDGVYEGELVTESTSPMSYLLN